MTQNHLETSQLVFHAKRRQQNYWIKQDDIKQYDWPTNLLLSRHVGNRRVSRLTVCPTKHCQHPTYDRQRYFWRAAGENRRRMVSPKNCITRLWITCYSIEEQDDGKQEGIATSYNYTVDQRRREMNDEFISCCLPVQTCSFIKNFYLPTFIHEELANLAYTINTADC